MSTANERRLVPPALLLGTVCAFVACCMAGHVVSRRNPFVGFQRFHHAISPLGLFYPTACQVRALGRELLDRDRIAVVVGGSSVPFGAGQRAAELWTRHLQTALGDNYRVINLALPAGLPLEFGGTAAEILARDCPRLIYIGDAFLRYGALPPPHTASARAAAVPVADVYRYFFWDAYHKGLLPPDPERQTGIRAWLDEQAGDARLAELVRGMHVDSVAYSRDLWTTLAYSRFCSVWSPAVPAPWTRPRRDWPDGDDRPLRAGVDSAINGTAVVQGLRLQVLAGNHLRRLASAGAAHLEDNATLFVPPCLRGRTLLLVLRENPCFVGRLSAAEQTDYRAAFPVFVQELKKIGLAAIAVETGCTAADFVDHCHLNESGGRKLAMEVAPAVRRLAHHLGYDEGERGRDHHVDRE